MSVLSVLYKTTACAEHVRVRMRAEKVGLVQFALLSLDAGCVALVTLPLLEMGPLQVTPCLVCVLACDQLP